VAATEPQRREAYFTLSSAIDLASAESILSAARQAAEAKVDEFVLCIASLGGHFGRALSIGAILEALPFEFVTFNISMVSSAANVLYISGERRVAAPHATFIFQPSAGGAQGTPQELEETVRNLRSDDEREALILAEKTGRPAQEIREIVQGSRQLTAEEALDFGIVHEIMPLAIPSEAVLLGP
jgi:ATP-dependent Clp protease, protease subunit